MHEQALAKFRLSVSCSLAGVSLTGNSQSMVKISLLNFKGVKDNPVSLRVIFSPSLLSNSSLLLLLCNLWQKCRLTLQGWFRKGTCFPAAMALPGISRTCGSQSMACCSLKGCRLPAEPLEERASTNSGIKLYKAKPFMMTEFSEISGYKISWVVQSFKYQIWGIIRMLLLLRLRKKKFTSL